MDRAVAGCGQWGVRAGGRQAPARPYPAGDMLPDEAVTVLKWNSWVRIRRTDVDWMKPRAADIMESLSGHGG